jgi:hypothetical protein
MAIEARRGCGYRKVGGLYLCSGGEDSWSGCCQLPIFLDICPTCHGGIKPSRGWQWVDPRPWLGKGCKLNSIHCPLSPMSSVVLGARVGLLWVGAEYYPTPNDFTNEIARMGVSRRIRAVPKGIELGRTWVWFAHPKVWFNVETNKWIGGVFSCFRPRRIEQIVTETQWLDRDFMQKLDDRGISAVMVPDDDPDHARPIRGKRQLTLNLETSP